MNRALIDRAMSSSILSSFNLSFILCNSIDSLIFSSISTSSTIDMSYEQHAE